MLKIKLIGTGACGTKAAIEAITEGVIARNNVKLINSTTKDLPIGYDDIFVQFENAMGGCAKERDTAKDLAIGSLQSGSLGIDEFITPDTQLVVIVTSTEGGTGSGSANLIATYIKEVLKCNVLVFGITGFEEDARGTTNTCGFFADTEPNFTIECISNKKYLSALGNNDYIAAQNAANKDFARKLQVISGSLFAPSEQNIDETDLYKLATEPKYMKVEYIELSEKIKNQNAFNSLMKDMLDSSKALDTNPSAKRIGVVLNLQPTTLNNIDHSFSVVKDELGDPFELYKQIQFEGSKEWIAIISSGMKMPIAEINAAREKAERAEAEKAKDLEDEFFAKDRSSLNKKSIFDTGAGIAANVRKEATVADKNNFFARMGKKTMPTGADQDLGKKNLSNKTNGETLSIGGLSNMEAPKQVDKF